MATVTKDTSSVSSYELVNRVGTSLQSKGYAIGKIVNHVYPFGQGEREEAYLVKSVKYLNSIPRKENQIAILKHDKNWKDKSILYRATHEKMMYFVGKLMLGEENWVMEVYGKKNESEMNDLAEKLSKENNVNILVKVHPEEKLLTLP